MAKNDIVPVYYVGQNRKSKPAFSDTRENIKLRRKAGEFDGWYQENGKVFMLRKLAFRDVNITDLLSLSAGASFSDSWSIRQSGYGGPLIWQLRTSG